MRTFYKVEEQVVNAVKDGQPVGVALIGSGRMGSFHGQTLAQRIPGARLVAVADPALAAAESVRTSRPVWIHEVAK